MFLVREETEVESWMATEEGVVSERVKGLPQPGRQEAHGHQQTRLVLGAGDMV